MASTEISHSVLAFKLKDLRFPKHLYPVIKDVVQNTSQRVLVLIFSQSFNDDATISHAVHWQEIQSLLTAVYAEAARVGQEQEKVLLQIDVLLKGTRDVVRLDHETEWHNLFLVENQEEDLSSLLSFDTSVSKTIVTATEEEEEGFLTDLTETREKESPPSNELPSTFPIVALGGTFDHLHSGHKILLSMAAWITSEKMIVGVTDDKLLQKKTNRHLLESLPFRMERVRQFLHLFKPSLICDAVALSDVYGPTAVDPNIQALVVSKETENGAAAIAKKRNENSLPPLHCFVIDVISATQGNLDDDDIERIAQAKLSSTFIRNWLANHTSSPAS